MTDHIPNLSELSVGEKDSLIVRLFGELDALRSVVENLQARVASLEAENKELRAEVKVSDLRFMVCTLVAVKRR